MANRLKKIMTENSITQKILSNESDVSTATISYLCNNKEGIKDFTKYKILNGLNRILKKQEHSKGKEYTFQEVFGRAGDGEEKSDDKE